MRDHKGLNEITRIIRKDIVSMIHGSKSGHPGGSLSAVEILTALYFDEMNVDPNNCKMEDRDRFVLSKGHAAPVLYATLAYKGYFDREELKGLRKIGKMLQGHPDMKGTPGVEMSTGSLGQGFSVACGMAMASKLDNAPWRVYTVLGDGEVQEGIVWEAAMSAAHYKLDNMVAFLDYNGLQIDGETSKVMNIGPIVDKFKAFGWNVIEIDGHDFDQIFAALDMAKETVGKPTMIVAKTVKGKGVSFMENEAGWHGTAPSDSDLEKALAELGGADNE
ncbi:transketolase [Romboutsia sedimentorum]|jgi:transketolase|uniref:Transketolase n=1 Tax=Romboutsia sedimentorum TaxID=1368474 RepID=A0ABT7ECZ5_9FIRM|nr:transketolase [Romboutsia sedimentorum]MDK2564811.1 transketolase [Romboutsia sedimentorum]MDK2586890.1 transketolase [Romboutsia sedimentorum]